MAKYETAKYEVIKKDGNFEIRKYMTFYSASIPEESIVETRGFNSLFNYISGSNKQEKKISMTTPVINSTEDNTSTLEFVMPSEYYDKELPEPQNENIKIKRNEWHLTAAVRFSGRVSKEKIAYYEKELLSWVTKNNYKQDGNFRLARYNPPFVPSFLRRNEILINIIEQKEM